MKKLLTAVLSNDATLRQQLIIQLSTLFVYALSWAVLASCVLLGYATRPAAWALAISEGVALGAFYGLLRSGASRRLADASMTFAQTIAGLTFTAWAYAVIGPAHVGMPMLMMLILLYGMFNLRTKALRWAGGYALALLLAVTWAMTSRHPEVYRPAVDWILFGLSVAVLPTVAFLAATFSHLRVKLKAQKAELAGAFERIQEMAIRDELTGLYNRRHMLALIDMHAKRLSRNSAGFTVALLDLDHFKRVNDTFGHQVGDEVLRGFAKESAQALRETDIMARWGGEEFLVLFPDTPASAADLALHRLHEHLAPCCISPSVQELRASFSGGVTQFREGESIEDAIERADRGLYLSKERGRNCHLVM